MIYFCMKSISARTENSESREAASASSCGPGFRLANVARAERIAAISFHTEVSAVEPHLKIELLEFART